MSEKITEKNWREFVPSIEDIQEFMEHEEENETHALEWLVGQVGRYAYHELGPIRGIVDAFIDHFQELGKPCRILFTFATPNQSYVYGIRGIDADTWEGVSDLYTGTIVTAVINGVLLTSAWDVQNEDGSVDRYAFELRTDPDTKMQQVAYCRADKIDLLRQNQMMYTVRYPADVEVHDCEWREMLGAVAQAMRAHQMSEGKMS